MPSSSSLSGASPAETPYNKPVDQILPGTIPTPSQAQSFTAGPAYNQYISSFMPVNYAAQKGDYHSDSANPGLTPPLSGASRAAAAEPAVQDIVDGFVTQMIITLLPNVGSIDDQNDVYNHLIKGTNLKNAKLQGKVDEIRSQTESEVQALGFKNFKLTALRTPNETAWIQTPLAPGAVNIGILSPENVGLVRTKIFMENTIQTFDNVITVSTKLMDALPKNDPRRARIKDFISAMIEATFAFKQALEGYQIILAQQGEGKVASINDLIKLRDKLFPKKLKETVENFKKQAKAHKMGPLMKVLGPLIGALITAITGLITAITLGAASPIFIAGMAVGIMLTTYSIIDSAADLTPKMLEGLNEIAEKATQDGSDSDKALFKFALVLSAVAMAAILLVAIPSGQGASVASNVATQTAVQVAKQATLMATRQLIVQAAVIFMMSSGVLLELPTEMLKLTGADETTSDVLRFMILAMEMVVVMFITHKLTTGMAAEAAPEVAKKVTQTAASTAAQQTGSIAKGVADAAKVAKETAKTSLDDLIKMFGESWSAIRDTVDPRILKDSLFNSIVKPIGILFAELPTDPIEKAAVEAAKKAALATVARTVGGMTENLTKVAMAGANAALHFSLADIYKRQGMTDKEQEQLTALIDLLNNFLKQLESSQTSNTELIQELTGSIDNTLRLVRGAGQKFTETARAATPA